MFSKGTVYVLLLITIGPLSFTIDVVPYLRAKTVRRLNRKRSRAERLKFRTKIRLAARDAGGRGTTHPARLPGHASM